MRKENEYVIVAGSYDRPSTVQRGVLEKGTGQTVMVERDITMTRPADIGFPNRTDAWARRVVKDKQGNVTRKGSEVKVTDTDYRGELEFLKWGHPDGSLTVCRYLKGYQTLDLLYQNLVLNADENIKDDNESSADSYYIRMHSGENVFDEGADPYWVQYLKIHDFNEDSISRNPNRLMSMFRNKVFEQVEEKIDFSLDSKFEALALVKQAADDNSAAKLKNLFNITKQITDGIGGEIEDVQMFSFLKRLADTRPDEFILSVNQWKLEVSETFEKAKIYNKLDLTKDGFIAAEEKNKFGIIAEGIDAKGEDMILWCVTNFLDPVAFECFFKLKKITDKLK